MLHYFTYNHRYTKERDSRLSRVFVIVGSSLIVWRTGLVPKIMIRGCFLRVRGTSLFTKIPTPSFSSDSDPVEHHSHSFCRKFCLFRGVFGWTAATPNTGSLCSRLTSSGLTVYVSLNSLVFDSVLT